MTAVSSKTSLFQINQNTVSVSRAKRDVREAADAVNPTIGEAFDSNLNNRYGSSLNQGISHLRTYRSGALSRVAALRSCGRRAGGAWEERKADRGWEKSLDTSEGLTTGCNAQRDQESISGCQAREKKGHGQ